MSSPFDIRRNYFSRVIDTLSVENNLQSLKSIISDPCIYLHLNHASICPLILTTSNSRSEAKTRTPLMFGLIKSKYLFEFVLSTTLLFIGPFLSFKIIILNCDLIVRSHTPIQHHPTVNWIRIYVLSTQTTF